MPFDHDAFAKDMVVHLKALRADLKIMTALPKEDRQKTEGKILNLLIDIGNVPEFVEAWFFGYLVEIFEAFISKKIGGGK